jgi:hypothetical protein
MNIDIIPNKPYIWKTKIVFKIKIFLWLLYTGIILTKNNLARKNWKGNKKIVVFVI